MKREGKVPKNVVIDLISGFPVPEIDTLSIYKDVITCLMEEMPPGWQKVLDSHVTRDRVIPDDMEEIDNRTFEEHSKNLLGIKLLVWGPRPNYHLRPGQTVEVEQFSNENTKQAYIILKGLIKLMKLKISTYMLKKTLLGSSSYRQEANPTHHIVKNAMVTPELFPEFNQYYVEIVQIDGDQFVPLTEAGSAKVQEHNSP